MYIQYKKPPYTIHSITVLCIIKGTIVPRIIGIAIIWLLDSPHTLENPLHFTAQMSKIISVSNICPMLFFFFLSLNSHNSVAIVYTTTYETWYLYGFVKAGDLSTNIYVNPFTTRATIPPRGGTTCRRNKLKLCQEY